MPRVVVWSGSSPGEVFDLFGGVQNMLRPKLDLEHVGSEDQVPDVGEGDVVLAMGSHCLSVMKAGGLVQKNLSIKGLRDRPVALPGGAVAYVTNDPFMVHTEADARSVLEWSLRLAHRHATTGSPEPKLGEYGWTTTLRYVLEYARAWAEDNGVPCPVSFDTETMGLWPWYPDKKVVSLQVSAAPGVADCVYLLSRGEDPQLGGEPWRPEEWARLMAEVEELLTAPYIVVRGANLKYDLLWLRVKWGVVCTNFSLDTLLVGSLLDENRSNSLTTHAKTYTPLGGYDTAFNATYDKGHMEEVPPSEMLPYAGGDADSCLRASERIKADLCRDKRLTDFYVHVLHPAARAMEAVEHRGMIADTQKFEALRVELTEYIEAREAEALAMMPRRLRNRWGDGLSLSKPNVLREYLFSPRGLDLKPLVRTGKTKEASTAKDHLSQFADHPEAGPFIALYEEWTRAAKTRSTFVDGFIEHLRPDGRFHPTYNLFAGSMYEGKDDDAGTVTGRLSAKNPPVQIIPKKTNWAARIRDCYPAPPGHVFFQLDYAQGELKVTACVAGEVVMLAAYREGKDLHVVTASERLGMEYGDFLGLKDVDFGRFKMYRDMAKPTNFGLLYGMQPPGFREYARKSYGVVMTQEEAEDAWHQFFATYPGLQPWHNRSINTAYNTGEVVSPLGRVRHLPLIRSKVWAAKSHAERQAINSPVQSCLSDMCLWSIALIEEALAPRGLQLVGMTHDSVYGYAPEDTATELLVEVKGIMENLPFHRVGWEPQIGFTVDAEVGLTMGSLEEVALTV